eukprot:498290-Rhodomonas_salina.2
MLSRQNQTQKVPVPGTNTTIRVAFGTCCALLPHLLHERRGERQPLLLASAQPVDADDLGLVCVLGQQRGQHPLRLTLPHRHALLSICAANRTRQPRTALPDCSALPAKRRAALCEKRRCEPRKASAKRR